MEKLIAQVHHAINNLALVVLVVKAKGGYKYRERIKKTDGEIAELENTCEDILVDMAVRVTVAEAILREKPPHYHERWEDYQTRLKEVAAQVRRKP